MGRLFAAGVLIFLAILSIATISALGPGLGLIMILALIWLAFLWLAIMGTARRLREEGNLQEGERVSVFELIRRAREAGPRPRDDRGDSG